MHFNSCYQEVLGQIAELYIWSNGINIKEIESFDLMEFEVYRSIFKSRYEAEAEAKKDFIKNTFEFARKGIEAICKSFSGSMGGGKKLPKGPSK